MDEIGKRRTELPRRVILLAVLVMLVSVLLPYAAATGDWAAWLGRMPGSEVIDETLGMTAREAVHLSVWDFTRLYGTFSQEIWNDTVTGTIYAVLFGAIVGLPVIAGLFALGRRPVGVLVFALLALGASRVQDWDYTVRGVILGGRYTWGIAHYLYPAAAVAACIGAVWLWGRKRKARKGRGAQVEEHADRIET